MYCNIELIVDARIQVARPAYIIYACWRVKLFCYTGNTLICYFQENEC